jgi:hypothetical protein
MPRGESRDGGGGERAAGVSIFHRHSRESGNPVAFCPQKKKPDSRFRGNDGR